MLKDQSQALKDNIVNIMASNMYGEYIHIFDFTECFITLSKTVRIPENYSLFCALSNPKLYYCCVATKLYTSAYNKTQMFSTSKARLIMHDV